jgi:hypothetical protein
MSPAANTNSKRLSADAEKLIAIAAHCGVKSLVHILAHARLKATGGLLVDLSDLATKKYANDRFQTAKLSATRGNLKVEFTEDLHDKLETCDVIERLYTMMNEESESVDYSIDAGAAAGDGEVPSSGQDQLIRTNARGRSMRGSKLRKLQLGVQRGDGNFDSISFNSAGRRSDDGTKILKSMMMTKLVLDPQNYEEVRLICLVFRMLELNLTTPLFKSMLF